MISCLVNLQDSLVKDKIIFRIKSNITREKLLIEENFDFNKAISICRLSEQFSKHFNEIESEESFRMKNANASSSSKIWKVKFFNVDDMARKIVKKLTWFLSKMCCKIKINAKVCT